MCLTIFLVTFHRDHCVCGCAEKDNRNMDIIIHSANNKSKCARYTCFQISGKKNVLRILLIRTKWQPIGGANALSLDVAGV